MVSRAAAASACSMRSAGRQHSTGSPGGGVDLYVTAELHTECTKQAAANNSGSPKCVQAESCTAVGACHKMDVGAGVVNKTTACGDPPQASNAVTPGDRRRTGINPRYVSLLTAPTRKHQRCSNPTRGPTAPHPLCIQQGPQSTWQVIRGRQRVVQPHNSEPTPHGRVRCPRVSGGAPRVGRAARAALGSARKT